MTAAKRFFRLLAHQYGSWVESTWSGEAAALMENTPDGTSPFESGSLLSQALEELALTPVYPVVAPLLTRGAKCHMKLMGALYEGRDGAAAGRSFRRVLDAIWPHRHAIEAAARRGADRPESPARACAPRWQGAFPGPPCPVQLQGEGEAPLVLGKQKKPLSPATYRIIKVLVDAYPEGLPGPRLDEAAGCRSASAHLRRLREDGDWKRVLGFPGSTRYRPGGYRILPAT